MQVAGNMPAGISVENICFCSASVSRCCFMVSLSYFHPTDNISTYKTQCGLTVGQRCFRWWELTRVMAGRMCTEMDERLVVD